MQGSIRAPVPDYKLQIAAENAFYFTTAPPLIRLIAFLD